MSRLRISGGSNRGIQLKVPGSARPTTERVRLAVFSILGSEVSGLEVADLYCGSGAWGLEALSRGAASAVFVDSDAQAVKCVTENLRACGRSGKVTRSRVSTWLGGARETYGLVFADPPYGAGEFNADTLSGMIRVVEPGGLLVLENRSAGNAPETPEGVDCVTERVYGDTRILVYRRIQK